jgi:hypothetical protein
LHIGKPIQKSGEKSSQILQRWKFRQVPKRKYFTNDLLQIMLIYRTGACIKCQLQELNALHRVSFSELNKQIFKPAVKRRAKYATQN